MNAIRRAQIATLKSSGMTPKQAYDASKSIVNPKKLLAKLELEKTKKETL